jgi:hypothetical protein
MRKDESKKATIDYWNRRMQRQAAPPTLAELLEELNQGLCADPGYRPGTRFILMCAPTGVEFPTWEGPAKARPLIPRVLQVVTQNVTLPVPFQMEGIVIDDSDSVAE